MIHRCRMGFMRSLYFFVLTGICIWLAANANAQSGLPFHDFESVLGFYHPDVLGDPAQGGAIDAEVLERLASVSAALQGAIANEIANLSISAAGTQYFFGPDRMFYVSENLGTFFIEPPWTTGEGNGSFGLNTSYLDFKTFQGDDLDEIFDFYDDTGTQTWDADYELRGQLTTLSMTYGVTERLDVGLIIPMVYLEGKGDGGFSGLINFEVTDFEESCTNVADVFLRFKYELLEIEDLNRLLTWSVGLDVKLDNGDEELLLGTGDFGYRLRTLIGKRIGRIYPVVEVGYYFAGVDVEDSFVVNDVSGGQHTIQTGIEDSDFDAFEFKFGLPVTLIDERWTLSAEWMLSHSDFATTNDLGVTTRYKINDRLFVQGGIRIPVDDDGLRTDFVPTIGGEFRF